MAPSARAGARRYLAASSGALAARCDRVHLPAAKRHDRFPPLGGGENYTAIMSFITENAVGLIMPNEKVREATMRTVP